MFLVGANIEKGLVRIGVAGVAGYYLLGKKPIGALVGIVVGGVLIRQVRKRQREQVMEQLTVVDDTQTGPPVATGIPAPGTTADPMDGTMQPGKRIGVLR